jgi:hypothetical protein
VENYLYGIINSLIMHRLNIGLFFILIFALLGCAKEEVIEDDVGTITAWTYKSDEKEINSDIQDYDSNNITESNIVSVRLCKDTDNSINKFVPGSIFGYYHNASRFEFDDYCISENRVMEVYCENETGRQKSFLCRHGCVDGHCK